MLDFGGVEVGVAVGVRGGRACEEVANRRAVRGILRLVGVLHPKKVFAICVKNV